MSGPPVADFRQLSLSIELDPNGRPVEYTPHTRYSAGPNARIHKYGLGPFCRLHVANAPALEGVYLVCVDGAVAYIGKCQDARMRWGQQGYGLISPRNCYVGGQPTNCKVNHRILEAAKAGRDLELWFRDTHASGPSRLP